MRSYQKMNVINLSKVRKLKEQFGASKEEWSQVFAIDELKPWVLPVVCNHNLSISPNSSIKGLGKTPTIKNQKGYVVGIKEWTTRRETTETDLVSWSQDGDYGYCIRTGNKGIIGIDCDVNDETLSEQVKQLFIKCCKVSEEDFTCRTRGNARWAVLIKLDTEANYSKSTIDLEGEDIDGKKPIVEFLGVGNQLACAGRHPSGNKYKWSRGIGLIHVTENDYKAFKDSLVMLYGAQEEKGTRTTEQRKKGETFSTTDRLRDWLENKGLVLDRGRNGELYIHCPWCASHTTDTGTQQTAYFPAGVNGYAQGGFKCLHAHCADKGYPEFKEWAKSEGYEELTADDYPDMQEETESGEDAGSNKEKYFKTVSELAPFLSEKTGLYSPSTKSLCIALESPYYIGYSICYDSFNGRNMIKPIDDIETDWKPVTDTMITSLRIVLEDKGFMASRTGKELVKDSVNLVAEKNNFDYMEEYFKNNIPKWDGVKRAESFLIDYCGAEDSEYTRAVGRYFWGLAWRRAANREPIKADISLILIGAQGANKSQFTRALALEDRFYIDLDFKNKTDEIALRIRGKLIAEVPEMNGFSNKANSELKAFLSLDEDTYRIMYSQDLRTVTRRNMLIITENHRQVLSDPTGNRRYAPVEVTKFDYVNIKTVIKQLWAEGEHIFNEYGGKKLHTDVEAITATLNENYMIDDIWQASIREFIDSQSSLDENSRVPLSTKNILIYALQMSPRDAHKQETSKRISAIMCKLGYKYTQKFFSINGEKNRMRVWELAPDKQ